jgi:GTP-binding protein Era
LFPRSATSSSSASTAAAPGRLVGAGPTLHEVHHTRLPALLGAGGERIKRIGSEARQDLERAFDCKVYLEVWVKIKSGWSDNEQRLKSYGYE